MTISAHALEADVNPVVTKLVMLPNNLESNATKLAVQQLSAMNKELYDLVAASSSFEKNNSYAKEKKDATDLYNTSLQKILTSIQQTLNDRIIGQCARKGF